eukprot:6078129-Prymnesium_polylepis.3
MQMLQPPCSLHAESSQLSCPYHTAMRHRVGGGGGPEWIRPLRCQRLRARLDRCAPCEEGSCPVQAVHRSYSSHMGQLILRWSGCSWLLLHVGPSHSMPSLACAHDPPNGCVSWGKCDCAQWCKEGELPTSSLVVAHLTLNQATLADGASLALARLQGCWPLGPGRACGDEATVLVLRPLALGR